MLFGTAEIVGLFAAFVCEFLDFPFVFFDYIFPNIPIFFFFVDGLVGLRPFLADGHFRIFQAFVDDFYHLLADGFIHLGDVDAYAVCFDDRSEA